MSRIYLSPIVDLDVAQFGGRSDQRVIFELGQSFPPFASVGLNAAPFPRWQCLCRHTVNGRLHFLPKEFDARLSAELFLIEHIKKHYDAVFLSQEEFDRLSLLA